jgi:GT2 family glycosyltransferase
MDVSIVIVTYNSRPFIAACLASIRGCAAGTEHEVIVVDNASPDGTAALVARDHTDVRLISRADNGGLSRAVNEGVATSSGDHVLWLNPDSRLCGDVPGVLSRYLREHPDVGIVAPRLVNEDGSLQLSCRRFPGYNTAIFNRHSLLTRLLPRNRFSRRYLMADFDHASVAEVDWLSGAAMMFPRVVFDRLGGLDEGFFMYNEDVDFCRRVHDAGFRVVYNPEVAVMHHIGGSTRTLPSRMVIERHRSIWRYYRKHMRGGRARDTATAGAIAARCGVLLAANNVRRLFGAQRA